MPTSKPFWQSKVVWLNIFTTLAAFLDLLDKQVPVQVAPYILLGSGLVNIILRIWFTGTTLTA